MFGFNFQFCFDICISRSSSPFKITVENIKRRPGQAHACYDQMKKKCFTRQKTAETKHRLCKISVQPHTSIILDAHNYCSKKTKGRTILNLCKRTAKFFDKLKPYEHSLTNRELKKQIFSNTKQHEQQKYTSTTYNIPSDYHFRYHCLRIFAFQRYSHSFPNNQT